MEVQLIYNVLISAVQKSESIIHMYVIYSFLFLKSYLFELEANYFIIL